METPSTPDPMSTSSPIAVPTPAVPPRLPLWRRIGTEALVIVVMVSLALIFAVVVLGFQVPGFAQNAKEEKASTEKKEADPTLAVKLVKDKDHTLEVPEDVRTTLLFRKGEKDLVVEVKAPVSMRPLMMPGSTALDPTKLARIRVRFAPAKVTEIGKTSDLTPAGAGKSALVERELRPGDTVKKDQVLAVYYSDVAGSKKNDLLNALVQLEMDQKILDRADDPTGRAATPDVLMYGFLRAVYSDRNEVNRALNLLKAWEVSQKEIDEIKAEAHKIASDKNAWLKTPEGRWVNSALDPKLVGEKHPEDNYRENPWGRVSIQSPFDGVIVERNLHVDELIVDNTVNHFQIADVSRLLVIANCPEDQLPYLQELQDRRKVSWKVRTVGRDASGAMGTTQLEGRFDEIGYLIDPMQHTAVIKGYVENPGRRLRAGQYVSATVQIDPPAGVVEVPLTALVDDGKQSLVFVQTDPTKPQFTVRRVQVTNRFEKTAYVMSTPVPKDDSEDEEDGLLPKEPLRPDERIIKTGAGELKLALVQLESKAASEAKQKKSKDEKK